MVCKGRWRRPKEMVIPNWSTDEFIDLEERITGLVDVVWDVERGKKAGEGDRRKRIKDLWERDLHVEMDFWPVFERRGVSNRGEEAIAVLRG